MHSVVDLISRGLKFNSHKRFWSQEEFFFQLGKFRGLNLGQTQVSVNGVATVRTAVSTEINLVFFFKINLLPKSSILQGIVIFNFKKWISPTNEFSPWFSSASFSNFRVISKIYEVIGMSITFELFQNQSYVLLFWFINGFIRNFTNFFTRINCVFPGK